MKQIIVNGIPVEVERKKIKNMYLKVLPPDGKVHISAPVRISEEAIKRFVSGKSGWIRMHQDRLLQTENQYHTVSPEYVSGETVSLWGKVFVLEVVYQSPGNNVEEDGHRLVLQVHKKEVSSSVKQREQILFGWYKEQLTGRIPLLASKWENRMGVKVSQWSTRNMKTRWGTCNVRDKKICLNLQLVKKDPDCLEYVVVHELVHLLEKSHNQVFKAYMDRFLPEWRSIKEWLNADTLIREPLLHIGSPHLQR